MTSARARIDSDQTCEKCGGQLKERFMVLGGRRVSIWQCRVCRYYQLVP
ncbi:MAG: hypothetical protein Kow0069_20680 [Promethearchaeota archaeon]